MLNSLKQARPAQTDLKLTTDNAEIVDMQRSTQ
jgi:hypothetical protein